MFTLPTSPPFFSPNISTVRYQVLGVTSPHYIISRWRSKRSEGEAGGGRGTHLSSLRARGVSHRTVGLVTCRIRMRWRLREKKSKRQRTR